MKAFAPSDTFVGLPERGRFATEPVILNFLIIRTKLAILTSKPSAFNDLKILSWEQTLFVKELYSSSRVIWNFCLDNLQMVWKQMISIKMLGLDCYHGSKYNRSESHARTHDHAEAEGFNLETLCVFTHSLNCVSASEFLFWLDLRRFLVSDNRRKQTLQCFWIVGSPSQSIYGE